MARTYRWTGSALVFLLLSPSCLLAQAEQQAPVSDTPVRLYMDCRASGCDQEFIRNEIKFVDHVREIQDADLYLEATSLATGAGGSSSELIFQGRGRFDGMADTLTFVSGFDDTADEVREAFTRLVKIGLMRYVGLTSIADDLRIEVRPPTLTGGPGRSGPTARPEDDPWDFWVFRVRGDGGLNGRSNYESRRFSGSVSANRVTEDWKVSLSLSQSYTESVYDYPELDYRRVDVRRSHTFTGSLTKSVAPKWSAGLRASARNATYYNFDFAGSLSPVLEYSVFPYEEATRRSLTFQYAVEGVYHATTLNIRGESYRLRHRRQAGLTTPPLSA
jgi:hypothetical protein